jgi:hypothetical protein
MDGWVGGVEWNLGTLLLLGCGWLCNSLSQVSRFLSFWVVWRIVFVVVAVVDHGGERETVCKRNTPACPPSSSHLAGFHQVSWR